MLAKYRQQYAANISKKFENTIYAPLFPQKKKAPISGAHHKMPCESLPFILFIIMFADRTVKDFAFSMQHFVDKVWVDNTRVYVRTKDGLLASYLFADWSLLRKASQNQREDFYLTYSGIHWPQIDEDLSFEGMFHKAGLCNRTQTENEVCYVG